MKRNKKSDVKVIRLNEEKLVEVQGGTRAPLPGGVSVECAVPTG